MDNNPYDKMQRAANTRKTNDNSRTEKSKNHLLSILEKKQRTIFIGAISAIEEEFGFLWGHGKKPFDRTPEEQKWFDRWQRARTKILNNGNNQSRAIQNELKQYTVNWEGYNLTLKPLKEQE